MKVSSFRQSSSHSKKFLRFIILFVLSAIVVQFFMGCATVGQDFPASRVANIQIGETSQDDIRTMFGSPWRVGIEDGQRTWTYGRYRYVLFSEKSAQDLLIRFDERNLVASYTFSTTNHQE